MNMLSTKGSTTSAQQASDTHVPGEGSLWLLIFGDMVVYGVMFLIFAFHYQQQPDVFSAAQLQLSKSFGFINTLILLTSSWMVAKGLQAVRSQPARNGSGWLLLAMLCGAAFVVSKVLEYGLKIQAGIVITSNDFFMFYYIITAFHLLHVLIGLLVLLFMWRTAKRPEMTTDSIRFLESGATFWHLVDLLWIMIFPLIYLLG